MMPEIADASLPDVFRAQLGQALVDAGVGGEECRFELGIRNSVQLRLGAAGDVVVRVLKKPRGACTPQPRSQARALEYHQESLFAEELPESDVVTVVWTWGMTRTGDIVQHLLMPQAGSDESDQNATAVWRIAVIDSAAALDDITAAEDIAVQDDLDEEFRLRTDDAREEDGDDPS
ncbi:hypothetical protein [Blastococcus aurantiacus]|nr:hypothetical protein [Blastococcus aurantiacus]